MRIAVFSLVLIAVNSRAMQKRIDIDTDACKVLLEIENRRKSSRNIFTDPEFLAKVRSCPSQLSFLIAGYREEHSAPVVKAFKDKDIARLKELIEEGYLERKSTLRGEVRKEPFVGPWIHFAISAEWLDGINLIILSEAEGGVHALDSLGRSPLLNAARWNVASEIIKLLLETGADPEASTYQDKLTALDYLKKYEDPAEESFTRAQESIKLIEDEIEKNRIARIASQEEMIARWIPKDKIQDDASGYQFLNAFVHKDLDHLKAFILKDILWRSVGGDHVDGIPFKVNPNAKIELLSTGGITHPLHVAIDMDWLEGVEFILQNEGNVNLKDSEGLTPLLKAAYYNVDPDIIEVLVEEGADLEAKDLIKKWTALDYLKRHADPALFTPSDDIQGANLAASRARESIETIEEAIAGKNPIREGSLILRQRIGVEK